MVVEKTSTETKSMQCTIKGEQDHTALHLGLKAYLSGSFSPLAFVTGSYLNFLTASSHTFLKDCPCRDL